MEEDVEGMEAIVQSLSAEEVLSELEELALERGIRFAKQRALVLVGMKGITKLIVRELYNAHFIPLGVFQETMIQISNRGKVLEEERKLKQAAEEKARKEKEEEDKRRKLEAEERKKQSEIEKERLIRENKLRQAKKRRIEKTYSELVSLCQENKYEEFKKMVLTFDDENGDRKELIDHQVNAIPGMSLKDRWAGSTLLMVACKLGCVEIAKFLVDELASTNLVDEGAQTALHWAAKSGHASVIRVLKNCDHNALDAAGTPALVDAIRGVHKEAVEVLLFNTDINIKDAAGCSPLLVGCEVGSAGIVRKLLDYSADTDARNLVKRTALMIAARWGHTKCCELLLERDCEVESRDKFGWNAVMYASRWNKVECLQVLLEQMPHLDVRDRKQGWSALMYAANKGHILIVRELLEAGANPYIKDIYGKTALDVGVGVEVLALLNDHIADHPESDDGNGGESDSESIDTDEFDDYN